MSCILKDVQSVGQTEMQGEPGTRKRTQRAARHVLWYEMIPDLSEMTEVTKIRLDPCLGARLWDREKRDLLVLRGTA